MSESIATLPTSTVGSFTAEAFAAHLAAQKHLPGWWLDRKRAAYEKFASLPMPKRGDEAWRFSNVGTLTLEGFQRGDHDRPVDGAHTVSVSCTVSTDSAPAPAGGSETLHGLARHLEKTFGKSDLKGALSLLFVNNGVAAHSMVTGDLAQRGVIVTTLHEALTRHPELLKAHFMAQAQKLGSEKFAALHTAFVGDGAFVYVPRGVELPAPIIIAHAAKGAATAVFPHTLVIAEENSKVTVVDLFGSMPDVSSPTFDPSAEIDTSDNRHFACGANDLYAAHGSQITYLASQNWSRETLSFQFNSTVVRRDARVQSLNLHLGARQARHESLSQLQAPGAFSQMLALTIAQGEQEFDQRTLQIHQAPNTKSDLLYKNALCDQSRTIFSGLIVVDPDAQKTDAYQSNRNLMLSDDAEANSLPGLEIQANDVRCTHGATSSRIDPEQEFYLESRGIRPADVQELLTFGFFADVLAKIENEALRESFHALIRAKLQPKS